MQGYQAVMVSFLPPVRPKGQQRIYRMRCLLAAQYWGGVFAFQQGPLPWPSKRIAAVRDTSAMNPAGLGSFRAAHQRGPKVRRVSRIPAHEPALATAANIGEASTKP